MKEHVSSQTFLGASESPRPNKGSTENPEITHEVMVSGANFRVVAFPSNLKRVKDILKIQFSIGLYEMLTGKLNNTKTRSHVK
jgi:hypothetical protein